MGSAAEPDGRAGPSRARGSGAGAGAGAVQGSHRGPRWAGGPRSRPGVLGAARAPGRRGARGAGLWRDGQPCGQSEGSAAHCCPIGSEGRQARAVAAGGDWGASSPEPPRGAAPFRLSVVECRPSPRRLAEMSAGLCWVGGVVATEGLRRPPPALRPSPAAGPGCPVLDQL